MFDFKLKNRGVALFVVLGTIFVVVILANIALNMMISQSRFTYHKVGRIQAYYAAWAAINYANEMLRLDIAGGGWNAGSCPPAAPCAMPADATFPAAVLQPINIILAASGTPACPVPPNPQGVTCIFIQVQYADPLP